MSGVDYTEDELLATHPFEEPLILGGVRCHGGFDSSGAYVPPRTLNRTPAITAWQAKRQADFGTPILDVPLATWPEHYPNVAQTTYLLEEGIRGPVVSTLTRIGTVEGFGAMIRHAPIPDLRRCLDEDISGTALAHLGGGLYEAHARDEAGYEAEAGHKQMWWVARDVAFENPVTEDETQLMLARMGFGGPGADPAEARRRAEAERILPADIDFDLEMLVARMVRILLIEVQAFHTFAWAEEVLARTDLVAGEGQAADLVSYIRADETPHVEYLKTALSELRDRTFVGESGRRYPGSEQVGRIWDAALGQSLGAGRDQAVATADGELAHSLAGHPRRADILNQYAALA
jgi:hypothetical protein